MGSLSAAIHQIGPVGTAGVGHLVDYPVFADAETVTVEFADLPQANAAVVHAYPDSADVVRVDPDSVPAVPVAADIMIFDPITASHRAIDARLK